MGTISRKVSKRTKRRTSSAHDPGASAVHARAPFPIVGIGASAGGLGAFEAFFSAMPADTDPGMAFVLVQHLAPDHKSLLADLIRRYTRMQVFEVEDGMAVRPNCTYIIPPNHDMAFLDGTLQLLDPAAPRGQRLPIDFFFKTLAQDQRERAIGVILSGTGGDGTQGIRAIKAEGGMVMAQNPESTEFDGMPRSAVNTGLVDYVLPPAEMPARLIAYAAHAFGRLAPHEGEQESGAEGVLKKIVALVRAQTGHDFAQYKPSTIRRRIERRMAMHQIETPSSYARFLQQTPHEAEALFCDLLIGVTSFFRDAEAFRALEEKIIPRLIDDKPAGAVIRVWSAGCSTGEEAYSIAMLMQERIEALKLACTLQVFATDIDSRAIAGARAGIYPASIVDNVSPERLSRFFRLEPDGSAYRINKNLRDVLIFSEQSVIKDPPFSRLDLISCRNLLIYLSAGLQKRLIPLFHYALNPEGILFLGTSEGIGDFAELFSVLDRKAKLYERKEDRLGSPRRTLGGYPSPITAAETTPMARVRGAGSAHPVKQSLRELTEQALLQQMAPVGALVDAQGDIVYLHGRSGMYLEPTPGEAAINNILRMAREGLRQSLSIALHKAVVTQESVRSLGLNVKTNGHFVRVNLGIHPLPKGLARSPELPQLPLYLILLEEMPLVDLAAAPPAKRRTGVKREAMADADGPLSGAENDAASSAEPDTAALIAALKQELRAKDEYLRATHEELETSNEELKSSNEEMQSVNEELQSSNEELETSKEELQSVNEELSTVNIELQSKVMDLTQVNNDMNNLLSGTGIGTLFVDHQLRILRFTPAATRVINLIPGDLGRPVAHVVSNLVGYDDLVADVNGVLDTLLPKEVEVQTTEGRWYSLRIHPYRTLDNVIEGAVITFVDIDEIVRARDALRKSDSLTRLTAVVRDSRDAVIVHDLDGRITAWNPAAERIYGWSQNEALAMNSRDLIPPELRPEAQNRVLRLGRAEVLEPYRTRRLTKTGGVVDVWVSASALLNASGLAYAIVSTEMASESTTRRIDGVLP